jgi:hypothetical protein
MNDSILTTLKALDIPLNSTVVKAIAQSPETVVLNAIAALAEAKSKGSLENPAGFLVMAIKNRWEPNHPSTEAMEVEALQQWFPLAKARGLALASTKSDRGILIYTRDEEWVPLSEMMQNYPAQSLEPSQKSRVKSQESKVRRNHF